MSNNLITTTTKPLITITGVLGKQGLSAAHTLLESGRYRVRGITRRINSPEAVNLASKGVELIDIPLDLGHYEDYVSAFRGSDGVFLMTPQIIPPATHEYELGKELADAAVEAGVGHIIFSSLENVDKISDGKLFVPHFTDKAKIEEYIRTLPITSSFIYMAFFYTNLINKSPLNTYIKGGCPIFNIAVESDDNHPIVKSKVSGAMCSSQKMFTAILKAGITNGEFNSSLNPEVYAFKMFAAIEGATVMCKSMNNDLPMKGLIESLKSELESYELK